MFLDNHRTTFREVADDFGILFGLCQEMFTHVLGMKRMTAKIVPKLQNLKTTSMYITQDMLMTFNYDRDLLKKVITGDQSWVYDYDFSEM